MTFLLTHWRLGFALILAATLGTYILVLKAELRYETGKRAEAETRVAQLTAAVTQWQEAAKQQNLAIEGWKSAAVIQDRKRAEAELRAKNLSAQIPQKVQEILEANIVNTSIETLRSPPRSEILSSDTQTTSQPPVSCEDAIQWLKDQAPALSSW